jgi:hypothetical protein
MSHDELRELLVATMERDFGAREPHFSVSDWIHEGQAGVKVREALSDREFFEVYPPAESSAGEWVHLVCVRLQRELQ